LSRTLADNALNSLSPEDADCARVINKSGENLLALINDILDLSKVEAGKLSLEMSSTRVGDIAAQLSEQFEPIARTRGLEFVVKCPDPDVVLITDAMRLQQILRNLLGNAFKFTDRGCVTLSVRNLGDAGAEFRVSDTGIGISKQAQKRIFDAFSQVDGTTRRRYEGTGLGLSISNELARLLNADLNVESKLGFGSEFVVVVPSVHPQHAQSDNGIIESNWIAATLGTETAHDPDDVPLTLEGFSVLVVEPDYRQSFALSRVLSEHGVDVSIADTCRLAAEMLEARQFDAILLDSSMHEKLGESAIRAATRRAAGDPLPVIMLAADRFVGAAARADNRICLPKPVAAESLLQALEDLLVVAA
jgi:two-component system chemotaxis sensor kinase CheA